MPGAKLEVAATPQAVLRRGLNSTARVVGLFSVLVCATLLYLHFHAATCDPWKSPRLLALKDKLVAEPQSKALKNQIRQLDYDFRRQFRRRLAMDRTGSWLLLAGALLTVVAAKKSADLNRPLQLPGAVAAVGRARALQERALWSVALTTGLVIVALALVSILVSTGLPPLESESGQAVAEAQPREPAAFKPPSPAELQANWPRFRGWDGNGATALTNAPLSWDGQTGRNVAWKSPIPTPGHSSPVVWSNQVFVTGGTAEKREVFSYGIADGRLLWRCEVGRAAGSPPKPLEVFESTGFAASTGATDGRHFYAIFANGDLAAVNFDGGIAWSKALGPLKNTYGHASSLVLWQGVLVVQLDQGESSKPCSKLIALDAATGRVRWERSRPVPASWATPIVIEAAGKTQIIALGEPWVASYSMADGNELWRADLLQNEIVPSPIFAGGFVIAPSPSSRLVALRPDGAGDMTKSGVVWTEADNVPDIACPVARDGLVFTVDSGGSLTCLEGSSGKKVWEHNLGLSVQASPIILGNRLLVLTEDGVAVQLEAGRAFKELARGELADKFIASPAFADGRIFLRGETNLFCLQSKTTPGKGAQTHAGN
jgi:outer membrane protein assembly factor BamB